VARRQLDPAAGKPPSYWSRSCRRRRRVGTTPYGRAGVNWLVLGRHWIEPGKIAPTDRDHLRRRLARLDGLDEVAFTLEEPMVAGAHGGVFIHGDAGFLGWMAANARGS
jgi:hypothetical protein